MGRAEDQQIVESSVIETDPLLNAYVQRIAGNIWREVDRKDVPYNLKIIKDTEVNSFATMGGYVYINEGLIDFVQSDDELAGVIGHETGHIERRHVLTSQSKLEGLNLLFGLASLFSPFIYEFGNLMEAGAYAKIQRADELQADRTGLQLMARAGYDPENMRTMLQHLTVLESEHSDLVAKYLQDHPNPDQRVAHLVGYPELDPKVVTEEQRLVQAANDREHGRYEFSMLRFENILRTDPTNAEALLGLGQDQIALGFPNKSEQTLAEAAQNGSPQTKALALARIASLREVQAQRVTLTQPNLTGLRTAFAAAQSAQAAANTAISDRRDQARDQLKLLSARTQALQYEIPNFNNMNVPHGSKLDAVLRNIESMSRSLNSAIQDSSTVISNVGSLERNKQSGLLKESNDILDEMQQTLDATPIPADQLAILPSYPSIFNELRHADSDMISSVDASRAALTTLDQSLGDVDALFRELLRAPMNMRGDINQTEYDGTIQPMVQKALTRAGLGCNAGIAGEPTLQYGSHAPALGTHYAAWSGKFTRPLRDAAVRARAKIQHGRHPYQEMLVDDITPGDVVVATIVAADIRSTPDDIVQQMLSEKKSPVDLADEHGMHAWPLEIFTGLIYLDYTDDPVKEMSTVALWPRHWAHAISTGWSAAASTSTRCTPTCASRFVSCFAATRG